MHCINSILWRRIFRDPLSVRHSSDLVKKVRIKDLLQVPSNTRVAVHGWVKSTRKHKSVTFLDVNDGSCLKPLQVVVRSQDMKTNCNYGSSIKLSGVVVHRNEGNPLAELQCESLELSGECDPHLYPFHGERSHHLRYTRQFPHLRPRQEATAAILRVRNCVERLIHEYYQKAGYLHVHTPIITSNDCEGAGELFRILPQEYGDLQQNKDDFFSMPAFLTVSGQLHLEACVYGIGDVYTLSPAFRAEKSRPKTHLSEFYMLEVELAFVDCLDNLLERLEHSLRNVIQGALSSCKEEINYFHTKSDVEDCGKLISNCLDEPFVRIDYLDAVSLLNKQTLSSPINWGDDLNAEHEEVITSLFGLRPVFIVNFPKSLKPFYALSNNDAFDTVASFDLLFPYCGELAGGTIRENRYKVLVDRLKQLGLSETYEWYTDLRQFGGIPHGGFGLGFDRLVKFLLGVGNIRDIVPFPRARRLCRL